MKKNFLLKLDIQNFAGGTLYDIKAKLSTVGDQLKAVENQLLDKLANPATAMTEINELKNQKNDLQERFSLLKEQHDRTEQEQKAKLNRDNPVAFAGNDKEKVVAAKAEFIRNTIKGQPVSDDAKNALRAIPSPNPTGGDNFLPTTMTNELISEPLVKNPLREALRISNIKGLELPKISFTLDDDDFITDEQTAKELKLSGGKVSFGRFKFKVFAPVSDTVMHGSDVDLVNYVEDALRSGLAAKEKRVAFTATPKTGEEHMSFYSTKNGIAEVPGKTKFEAIQNALTSLHENYRENAVIIMTYADFTAITKDLAGPNGSYFDAPPEKVFGKPIIFSDSAVNPIVGDFGKARLNYEGELIYETDKDVKTGDYLFVLTAWFDMQILLKSAFRIAKVVATPTP
ncbi:phage major capsid protein [Paenibacillus chitinolyticus]|uniref:phage major capsid protein n=1 Tax=Paenibacillus chitinolyticus TaxID=79263 RepID=UPI002DBA399A|nr:phage major capsid protein [Paenibacillus chitinolyticus]MEC0248894.1 phage major capsid protein [Paenibacillus chitinolyticus]